jgi:hypothetical protein
MYLLNCREEMDYYTMLVLYLNLILRGQKGLKYMQKFSRCKNSPVSLCVYKQNLVSF